MKYSFWILGICLFLLGGKAKAQKTDYLFHEAEKQMLAGQYDSAYELFSYILEKDTKSGAALYNLSNLNRFMREDSLAILCMEKAVKEYPDNYWYQDMLVKLYFNNHKTDEAQVVLEGMASRWPEKTDVLMMLIDLYTSKNDYDNLIKSLDKLEVKEGKSEQISMEKFRIYFQQKNEEAAFKEMKALAEEYPNDLRYQVLIGDLYLDQNKTEDALKIYNDVLEKDSNNINAQLSLSTYYSNIGNDSLYNAELEKIVTNTTIGSESRNRLMHGLIMRNLQTNEDSTVILNLFDKVLLKSEDTKDDLDMLELCARYMVTKQVPEEKIKPILKRILNVEPESDMAREQLLQYALDAEDTSEVISICKPAVDYTSSNPVFYYYLSVAYFQKDSLDGAAEALKKCLDKADDKKNITLITSVYGLLGDIYHKQGKLDKCFEVYDSCLIYRPDDALVLNNYAYYLSLKKTSLDKAEEMSRKANQLSPDNPTYLDTLAWVLYQKKRYKEAKELIDKVIELSDPKDLEEDGDVKEHIKQINKKVK